MKKRDRLKLMGSVVTVGDLLLPHETDSGVRTWKPVACPLRSGWVVGFTHRRNGKSSFCYEDGPTFVATGTVPCVLVTFWPNHAPVAVPLNGFIPGGVPDNRTASWQDERVKSILREEAKTAPRKRGRFCKNP